MTTLLIGNRMAWKRIGRLEVGEEIESNHQSVTVRVEGVGGVKK